jgi:hypothetical protein
LEKSIFALDPVDDSINPSIEMDILNINFLIGPPQADIRHSDRK